MLLDHEDMLLVISSHLSVFEFYNFRRTCKFTQNINYSDIIKHRYIKEHPTYAFDYAYNCKEMALLSTFINAMASYESHGRKKGTYRFISFVTWTGVCLYDFYDSQTSQTTQIRLPMFHGKKYAGRYDDYYKYLQTYKPIICARKRLRENELEKLRRLRKKYTLWYPNIRKGFSSYSVSYWY